MDHLSPVLEESKPLRYDLIVYARLLQLVCHYRLGHYEFVGYGINNLARYLGRIAYRSTYPALVIQLLRGLLREEADAFPTFERGLLPLKNRIFNLREFRYFDAAKLLAM